MKGKGKSMIPSAEADIAHYGDNGKRRKLAVASKSLTLVLYYECRDTWIQKQFCLWNF